MKLRVYFLILFFGIVSDFSLAQHQKKAEATLTEATVYLNRAHLVSEASIPIEAGKTELIVEKLPSGILPASIQVSGKGGYTILGVNFEENYQEPLKKSKELLKLEDSLRFYEFQLSSFRDFDAVMKKEEDMLVANQAIGGNEQALDADDLEYFANFYRKRLLDIRFQVLKNNRDIRDMTENVNRIKMQINEIGNQERPASRIKVHLSSDKRQNAKLELSYIVLNAGWYPVYDFRVKEVGEQVDVSYKAMVFQQTGIDWENVKVTLSTSNPSISGIKPDLSPWYLSIYQERTRIRANYKAGNGKSEKTLGAPMMDISYAYSMSDFTEVAETSVSVVFNIGIPYTIPDSPKGRMIDIQNLSLPADYRHFAVPKLSPSAYLVALVNDYEDKNLLSGKANVYFQGAYVGETFLDMSTTEDTLEISLGVDNNVVVERSTIKEFRSKKLLGFNKKEEFAYRIRIRNTKSKSIDITVQDQFPLSQDKQIKIETVETSGASLDEVSGMLEWKKILPPAETLELVMRYNIEYPKNKRVSGIR